MPFPGHFDDDGFGARGATAATGAFTRQFRCYPVAFIDKPELDRGDKIVLPPSALDTLARLNITFPMLFQLESRDGRKTHCGVQEFIAEEGHANLPYWLMQNLVLSEGGMITIRNANLPKGNFVKFQPQTSDFLDISNPKAVLEATLRNFTCLTKGDSIAISYNSKTFWIDVLEVAPGDAISIIETDVNVEFAAPADYVEPERAPASSGPTGAVKTTSGASGVTTRGDPSARLKERLERLKKRKPNAGEDSSDSSDDDKPPPKEMFPGSGQALKARGNGRGGLTFGSANVADAAGAGPSAASGSGAASARSAANSAGAEGDVDETETPKKPFEAFSGKGRTMR